MVEEAIGKMTLAHSGQQQPLLTVRTTDILDARAVFYLHPRVWRHYCTEAQPDIISHMPRIYCG